MGISINEAYQMLSRLNREIKAVLDAVGDYCDNVSYDYDNLEEKFLRSELYLMADKLDDVKCKIDYLSKPVREQGMLYHNSDGRYELPSGDYFTSGSTCEILFTSVAGEKEWLFTSIEHNGQDYYATVLGRNVNIEGMTARIRR